MFYNRSHTCLSCLLLMAGTFFFSGVSGPESGRSVHWQTPDVDAPVYTSDFRWPVTNSGDETGCGDDIEVLNEIWQAGSDSAKQQFAPAPIVLEGAPAPRKMQAVKAILGAALTQKNLKRAKTLRVVLCASGKDAVHDKPGLHDYPLWQKRWTRLLGFAAGIRPDPADTWPSKEQWKQADIIVFNSYNPAWSSEKDSTIIATRGKDIDRFLARGGGLVFIHYALNAGPNAAALASRLGLAWGKGSRYRHGASDWILDRTHPLAAGFTDWQIPDESYWNMTGSLTGKARILVNSVEESAPQPQMWTLQHGKGRIFISVPGHYTWTYDDPLFRILLFRGMMWSARQPIDRLAPLTILGARVEP